MMISAKNVTPSISAAAMIIAVWMLPAVSGWRAMLSTADLASPPMPSAAPMITRPTPMARRSENGALGPSGRGDRAWPRSSAAWADAAPCASSSRPTARTADLTNFIGPLTPRVWSPTQGERLRDRERPAERDGDTIALASSREPRSTLDADSTRRPADRAAISAGGPPSR